MTIGNSTLCGAPGSFRTAPDQEHDSPRVGRFLLVVGAILLLAVPAVYAQTITVLHNFTGGGDGAYPYAGLTMDRAGNLYGTTSMGGAEDYGEVFRLSHAGSGWILTPLYSFKGYPNDGAEPFGGVIIGPDGSLYGMTPDGGQYGYGTVYRLRPKPTVCTAAICPWEETVLYSFTDGADGWEPGFGNLVFDQAGNLYGTASSGGANGGGVVFKLAPSNGGWTESVLWSFSADEGSAPESSLIFDTADNLYGTTNYGGTYNAGTVFELSPSGSGWTEQTLASIDSAANTCGGVVMDGQGNLFGASGCFVHGQPGGVFELTPSNGSWAFNVLHAFTPSGYNEGPWDTPTLDAAGNVYGTSSLTGLYSYGEVFKLTPSNGGWIYTSVSFDFTNGDGPVGSVVFDAAGNIYGTTAGGGAYNNGTVWEITP
jgi:uncharacterized repeat protein (TIGR03803 family)